MTLTDPDSANVSWAVVEVSGLVDGPNNTVEYVFSTESLPIAENRSTVDGTGQYLRLAGVKSIEQYRRYIRSLRYVNWKDEPTPGVRTVKIFVSDVESAESNAAFTNITVQPVNDHTPVFSNAVYMGFVHENRPVGTSVNVTVVATDGDDYGQDQLRFSIDGPFNVNAVTGVVTTNAEFDRDVVNGSRYTVKVTVEDHRGESISLSGVATVIVDVGDVNDNAPAFGQDVYSMVIREDLAMGAFVVQVAATDLDEGTNAEIMFDFEMAGSGTPDPFEINPSTGTLSTTRPLDYEDGDVYFELTVVATDRGVPLAQSSSTVVRINVSDVNDNAPVFEMVSYTLSVLENATDGVSILTVRATDKDSGDNSLLRFELVGSDRPFRVAPVGPSVAEIIIDGNLDYEMVKTYDFIIVARDHGQTEMSTETTVHVDVVDVNDNDPVLVQINYVSNVSESAPVGTVIANVTATDADSPRYGTVSYVFTDGRSVNGPFQINSLTGLITVLSALDYEVQQSHSLRVRASDGSRSAVADVYVRVLDENDNSPKFNQSTYSKEISENVTVGSTLLTVNANDADSGKIGTVSYRLTGGNERGHFEVGKNSGDVILKTSLDFETNRLFVLEVSAEDGGRPPLNGSTTVVISVTDVNDNVPTVVLNATDVNYVEDSPAVKIAEGIQVTDKDSELHPLLKATVHMTSPDCEINDPSALAAECKSDPNCQSSCGEMLEIHGRDHPSIKTDYNSDRHMITLTGSASPDAYQSVLSTLMYSHAFDEPPPGQRTLSITVSDSRHSASGSVTVSLSLRDDHVQQLGAATLTFRYLEESDPIDVGRQTDVSVRDADRSPHNLYRQLRVSFDDLPDGLNEVLSVNLSTSGLRVAYLDSNGSGYVIESESGSGDDGIVELQTSFIIESLMPAVADDFLSVFRSLTYVNGLREPTAGIRVLSLTLHNQWSVSTPLELRVDVLTSDEHPPQLNVVNASTQSYVEESGELDFALSAGLTITDDDLHDPDRVIQSATVTLQQTVNDEELNVDLSGISDIMSVVVNGENCVHIIHALVGMSFRPRSIN